MLDWLLRVVRPIVLWDTDPYAEGGWWDTYGGGTGGGGGGGGGRGGCPPGKVPNPHGAGCVPAGNVGPCPEGKVRDDVSRRCIDDPNYCPPGQKRLRKGGPCVTPKTCPEGQKLNVFNECTPGPNEEPPTDDGDEAPRSDAECSGGIPGSAVYRNGRCYSVESWGCLQAGREWVNGECLPPGGDRGGRGGGTGGGTGGGATGPGGGGGGSVTSCPEGQARVWEKDGAGRRTGRIICQDIIKHTPTEIVEDSRRHLDVRDPKEMASEIRSQLGEFDPRIDQPGKFRAPSYGDILSDPRYLTAAREQDRAMRAGAAAAGVSGAPLLQAHTGGRQALLESMYGSLYGQDLQDWQAAMTHGQDTERRYAGAWGRDWEPTRFAYQDALGRGSLNLNLMNSLFNRQNQEWNQWWLPTQQQRQFGQQRWLTEQENLMNVMLFGMGLNAPGLTQRT